MKTTPGRNRLTVVIFIDQWYPIPYEPTNHPQYRRLSPAVGEVLEFGPGGGLDKRDSKRQGNYRV